MQSKLTIRFARENDWDEIEQITSQNFSFQGLADTGSDSLRAVILEFEDQVIGACILQSAKQAQAYLTLLSLGIHPMWRKQGFGTLLLATVKSLVVQVSFLGIRRACQEELVSYFEMNDFQLDFLEEGSLGGIQLI